MNKAHKLLNKVLFRIPTRLPFGMAEFDQWVQSIIETYDFPNNDSFRWSIATIVQSLDQARADVSKHYISLRVRKGAANQLAGEVMWQLKEKQKLAQEEAKRLVDEAAKEEAEKTNEGSEGPAA